MSAKLGSISSATMRKQDLIPCFLAALGELVPDSPVVKDIESRACVDGRPREEDDPYWTSEKASYDLNETLFTALDAHAPPFCYFGAHEGDGADYGFWVSTNALRDAEKDGDLVSVDDLSEWEAREDKSGVEFVGIVSDHGNLTVYRVTEQGLTELWAIV